MTAQMLKQEREKAGVNRHGPDAVLILHRSRPRVVVGLVVGDPDDSPV